MKSDESPIMYLVPEELFIHEYGNSTESEYFEPIVETRLDQIKKRDRRARWRKENKKGRIR